MCMYVPMFWNVYGDAHAGCPKGGMTMHESDIVRLVATLEHAPIGIAHVRPDGTFVFANQYVCALLDYTHAEFMALNINEVAHPQDLASADGVRVRDELYAGTRATFTREMRFMRRDQSAVWVRIHVKLAPNHNGERPLLLVVEDISARRHAEIALRATDEALRYQAQLLDIVDKAVMCTDLHGTITYWNRFAETLYGWRAEEVLGRQMSTVVPFELSPDQQAAILQRLGRGESWSAEILLGRRDGSRFLASLTDSPIRDANGTMVGIVGVSFDITARVQAEERVVLLDTVSSHLAGSLDCDAVLRTLTRLLVPRVAQWCAVDLVEDGRIERAWAEHGEDANTAVLAARPWPYAACGSSPDVLVPFERARWFDSGDEQFAAHAHGSRSVVVVPLIARGRTLGAMVVGTTMEHPEPADIDMFDELARRAASALDNALLFRETQRAVHARDEFLSIAAHELRTPLTAMVGYSQLIERRLTQSREVKERDLDALRTIMTQAARMSRLMGLLLDISRMETGQFTLEYDVVDLCELADHALDALQPTLTGDEQPRVVIRCSHEAVLIEGDVLRLEQVVYNLLQNAIKYSPRGGQITLTIDKQPDRAMLAVTDQGIGIPSAAIPHLFDRFYRVDGAMTRSITGIGIGLYVVREVVERHGGTVEVSSVEGQGSTFTVYLPYHRPPTADHRPPTTDQLSARP
jgi:PAS domain S-box-containing protein